MIVDKGKVSYKEAESAIHEIFSRFFAKERYEFQIPGTVWRLVKRGSTLNGPTAHGQVVNAIVRGLGSSLKLL